MSVIDAGIAWSIGGPLSVCWLIQLYWAPLTFVKGPCGEQF